MDTIEFNIELMCVFVYKIVNVVVYMACRSLVYFINM